MRSIASHLGECLVRSFRYSRESGRMHLAAETIKLFEISDQRRSFVRIDPIGMTFY